MEELLAKLLHERFQGREDTYAIQVEDGGYRPQPGAFTVPLAVSHLRRATTLGLYVLRSDHTCSFGAIDFDVPNYPSMETMQLAIQYASRILRHFGLDHLIEFSGNKGYHLWTFFAVPLAAEVVQGFLRSLHAQVAAEMEQECLVEIFPKQTRLTGEAPFGNLIKLPWGRHRKTNRRALFVDSEFQPYNTMAEQIQVLQNCRPLTELEVMDFLREYPPPEKGLRLNKLSLDGEKSEVFGKGSVPCTKDLFRTPIEASKDGGRNQRIFDLAVRLYREGHLEVGALDKLIKYNKAMCRPPMEAREVQNIARQVYSKGYSSLHCEDLKAVCVGVNCAIYRSIHNIAPPEVAAMDEASACPVTDMERIGSNPPVWLCRVSGVQVQLVGDELMIYTKFRSKVFQALSQIFNVPRKEKQSAQNAWEDYLAPLIQSQIEHDAPEDASEEGRLKSVIEDWIREYLIRRPDTSELRMTGNAYLVESSYPKMALFRFETLRKYLEQRRIGNYQQYEIWSVLKSLNARSKPIKVGKDCLRVVHVPITWDLSPDEDGGKS